MPYDSGSKGNARLAEESAPMVDWTKLPAGFAARHQAVMERRASTPPETHSYEEYRQARLSRLAPR